jgi:hypothetical protein
VGTEHTLDEGLARSLATRSSPSVEIIDDPRIAEREAKLRAERAAAIETVRQSRRPAEPSPPPPAPTLPVEPLKRCRIRVLKSIVGFAGQVWEVGSEHEVGLEWARERILAKPRDPRVEIIEEVQ